MKAVILAGGHGTRISEETHLKPKPMIEIGGKPILWHIMKTYSTYGVNDFVICCGYKSHVLKQFFLKYLLGEYDHDMINKNPIKIQAKISESWNVTLVDTGLETMTGGRLKKIKEFVDNDTLVRLSRKRWVRASWKKSKITEAKRTCSGQGRVLLASTLTI